MPRLENWSIGVRTRSEYEAPELGFICLYGNIYEDDRFEDETPVSTSKLKEFNSAEMLGITKSGTKYKLGNPSQEFIKYMKNNNIKLEDYDTK